MSGAEWGWHGVTRGVIGLHKSMDTLSPHHLLNHRLGHSLISQALMDGQEIDLAHSVDGLATNHYFLWTSDDTCQDLTILRIPNHEVQIFDIARLCCSPPKLFFRILEPEVTHIVFDVVVFKEVNYFIDLSVILNIKSAPLESRWKRQWLS